LIHGTLVPSPEFTQNQTQEKHMHQIPKKIPEKSLNSDNMARFTERSHITRTQPAAASSLRLDHASLSQPPATAAPPVTTPCHPPAGPPPGGPDLSIALNLRRRQPPEVASAMLALAAHIPRSERRLIHAVYAEGRSLAAIADAAAQSPFALRRAYRRIVTRMLDPRFAFVAAHAHTWPAQRRLVATLHILRACTLRDTAARLAITEHAVRRELAVVHALFDEFTANI
jgi:DNA-directed RNA polymerase specialized sigma24 family protein